MGEARRRGTFEQRKNAAIIRDEAKRVLHKVLQAERDAEADKSYDSERPYSSIPTLEPYFKALDIPRLK